VTRPETLSYKCSRSCHCTETYKKTAHTEQPARDTAQTDRKTASQPETQHRQKDSQPETQHRQNRQRHRDRKTAHTETERQHRHRDSTHTHSEEDADLSLSGVPGHTLNLTEGNMRVKRGHQKTLRNFISLKVSN